MKFLPLSAVAALLFGVMLWGNLTTGPDWRPLTESALTNIRGGADVCYTDGDEIACPPIGVVAETGECENVRCVVKLIEEDPPGVDHEILVCEEEGEFYKQIKRTTYRDDCAALTQDGQTGYEKCQNVSDICTRVEFCTSDRCRDIDEDTNLPILRCGSSPSSHTTNITDHEPRNNDGSKAPAPGVCVVKVVVPP